MIMAVTFFISFALVTAALGDFRVNTCRSYCGNLTVDYPFGLRYGCGHPAFRDLLFCVNDVLMFHIASGSYRVLDIDYAYRSLTLDDPHMSTCNAIVLGGRGNGFTIEDWRAPYFNPSADNVFMLIGCSARSRLFQGFPETHLPCRNISGMGCEDYYGCPAWDSLGHREIGSAFTSGPPLCCAVAFESIKAINLTKLECEGYSSAYSLAPLRLEGPGHWAYGIRVGYSVQGSDEFCRACKATGGTCGYETAGPKQLCLCGNVNSTTNCDSVSSSSNSERTPVNMIGGAVSALTVFLTMPVTALWNRGG